jgi:hypothetical protein
MYFHFLWEPLTYVAVLIIAGFVSMTKNLVEQIAPPGETKIDTSKLYRAFLYGYFLAFPVQVVGRVLQYFFHIDYFWIFLLAIFSSFLPMLLFLFIILPLCLLENTLLWRAVMKSWRQTKSTIAGLSAERN